MNKKAIIVGAAIVLVIGATWSLWLSPKLDRSLTEAAQQMLADAKNAGVFDHVSVSFSSRVARLDGQVASEAERGLARQLIAERVRVQGLGSGFNLVAEVVDQLTASSAFAAAHPKPWLLVILANGSVTIAGVLPSETERSNAAQALTTRLAPPPTRLDNQLTAPTGARPARDLEGTLRQIPDLAAVALADTDHAVLATSLCDGSWSAVSSAVKTDNAALGLALQEANADPRAIHAATSALRAWQNDQQHKQLVAALPAPAVTLGLIHGSLHAFGTLGDEGSRRRLLIALSAAYPTWKLVDHLTVGEGAKPEVDFSTALAASPKAAAEAVSILVLKPEAKPTLLDGGDSIDAMKRAISGAGGDAAHAQPLLDAIAADKKR